jgi:hypothetical protein
MTVRAVQFDRALRPEWLDRALAVRAETQDGQTFRNTFMAHLEGQVRGPSTRARLAQQFQRMVGHRSRLPATRLSAALEVIKREPEPVRERERLRLLLESTPFLADCARVIERLAAASGDTFTLAQLTARMEERYGHRKSIPPTVRHALQTLEAFGGLAHQPGRWTRLPGLTEALSGLEVE